MGAAKILNWLYIHSSSIQLQSSCIQLAMTERWELMSQSVINNQQQLAHILQYIFSDQFIYVHQDFRNCILQDRKGYVPLQTIARISLVQHFFHHLQIQIFKDQLFLICKTINESCSSLIVKNFKARRLCSFEVNKINNIKPLCIQRILEDLTASDIRQYLGITAFTTTEDIKPHLQQFILVYAPDYRQALIKMKQLNEETPFRILDYQQLCRQRDRQSRFWEQRQLLIYKQFDPSCQDKKDKKQSQRKGKRQLEGNCSEEMTEERYQKDGVINDFARTAYHQFNNLLTRLRHQQLGIE